MTICLYVPESMQKLLHAIDVPIHFERYETEFVVLSTFFRNLLVTNMSQAVLFKLSPMLGIEIIIHGKKQHIFSFIICSENLQEAQERERAFKRTTDRCHSQINELQEHVSNVFQSVTTNR